MCTMDFKVSELRNHQPDETIAILEAAKFVSPWLPNCELDSDCPPQNNTSRTEAKVVRWRNSIRIKNFASCGNVDSFVATSLGESESSNVRHDAGRSDATFS